MIAIDKYLEQDPTFIETPISLQMPTFFVWKLNNPSPSRSMMFIYLRSTTVVVTNIWCDTNAAAVSLEIVVGIVIIIVVTVAALVVVVQKNFKKG